MVTKGSAPETKPRWFDERPLEVQIPKATRKLFEEYSKVSPNEVENHIVALRNEAWDVAPYPCIGQFRFLEPGINDLDEYNEVIDRLRHGQTYLDMACCFGQTVRRLVHDGAPSENMHGCDLQPEFIELGYKLFKDKNKLQAKFFGADVFDPGSALKDLTGKVDIVYAGSFFHLWGLDTQRQVSKSVALLLRPQPGSMILGRQMGATTAEERPSPTGTMYRHNVESFKKLWKEIGDELGITFRVEASIRMLSPEDFENDGIARRLYFSIRRE